MAKLVFMGSPQFAVPSLRALHAAGHEIVAVYSQPPRPAGRGQKLQKTAVHEVAEELGLAVFTPEKLKGADFEFVMGLDAEIFCVVAYGLLLPKLMVDNRICLNVHPSALPKWRGAAPLQWTLISGDTTTDVCVMRLDAGMDTGPVVMRESLRVPTDWTFGLLQEKTAEVGAWMLTQVVGEIAEGADGAGIVQTGETSHAPKISSEMRAIDWRKSADEVHNLVRGLSPSPAATAVLGDEVFKVIRTEVNALWQYKRMGEAGEIIGIDGTGIVVACGVGALKIVEMQRPGSKAGVAGEIARGWPLMTSGAQLKVTTA